MQCLFAILEPVHGQAEVIDACSWIVLKKPSLEFDFAVTCCLIRKYRQSGMIGLAVSILTSWAGISGVKRFGGNACTFLYLLFDKACNTMYFTKLWCFAVEFTLRSI